MPPVEKELHTMLEHIGPPTGFIGFVLFNFYLFVCLFDCLFVCLMVLSATFNNISIISWRSVLLAEETEGLGETHRPVASH